MKSLAEQKHKENTDICLRDIVMGLPEFKNGDPIFVVALLEKPEYIQGRKYAYVRGIQRMSVTHIYGWFKNQARIKNGILVRLDPLSAIRTNLQNSNNGKYTIYRNMCYRAVYKRRDTWM